MKLDEITAEEFKNKLKDPLAEIKKRVDSLNNDEAFSIFGWKAELHTDGDSRITGAKAPYLYIYSTKPGTTLRDIDRIFIIPTFDGIDMEETMRDYGRVEYKL